MISNAGAPPSSSGWGRRSQPTSAAKVVKYMADAAAYEAALQAAEKFGYARLTANQKNLVDRLANEASSRGKRARKILGIK